MRPLLGDSLDEISLMVKEKFAQSELQAFLVRPHSDVVEALGELRTMLLCRSIKAQMSDRDRRGWTPLDYAAYGFPEAVEVLLQAGSSLKSGAYLLHQRGVDQWKAVSVLIRAGHPTNARDVGNCGRPPLQFIAANVRPSYRHALELLRHGSHLLDWEARDDFGRSPVEDAEYWAKKRPDNEQQQLICELYRAQRVPPHAQYISSFKGELLMDAEEAATYPRISLIDTALAGNIDSIQELIAAGAMVNERDEAGRTLLHLIAMGDRVPHGYRVALELVRNGGQRGIDWDALTDNGMTARQLAKKAWQRDDLDGSMRAELAWIRGLLKKRCLPPGTSYVYPCMHPDFCHDCSTLPCTCPENDVRGMPGSLY